MKKNLLKAVKFSLMLLFCLVIGKTSQAQVIFEDFGSTYWATATVSTGNTITNSVTATTASVSLTSWSANTTTGTGTANSASYTTAGGTVTGNWSWYYSKASVFHSTANTSMSRRHSNPASLVMGSSSSFLITPVIPNGVTTITFWAITNSSTSSPFQVGLNTNTTLAVPTTGSSSGGTAYLLSSSNIVIGTAWAQYTYSNSGTYTGLPARLGLYNSTGQTLEIDDITITQPTLISSPPTLTAAGSATVDANFNITYTDNSTWRGVPPTVTVKLGAGSTNTLPVGAYSFASGILTLKPAQSSFIQTAGTYTVTVSATGYTDAIVSQVIGVGAANKLSITTQPTSPASNGSALAQQPVVAIQDRYGNATTSTASVVATVGAGSWTIGGSEAAGKAAVSGTATFTNLTATSVASVGAATITFSSGSLTTATSSSFSIPAPSGAIAAPSLTAAEGATMDDPFDISYTDDATWRAASPTVTVKLGVGATNTLPSGAFSFTSGILTIDPSQSTYIQTAGTYTITVSATGYLDAVVTQTIGAGSPNKLGIKTALATPATFGGAFATQPAIYIQDIYGNTTSSTATVTAAVTSPQAWTLGGSEASAGVAAVAGTATFTNLTGSSNNRLSLSGSTITFTCGALTSVISASFTLPADVSAATDYFRSVGGTAGSPVAWATAATWETSHDGTNWYGLIAAAAPTSSAKGIEIATGTYVSVGASLTTPAPTVNTAIIVNGNLSVASTFVLTLGSNMTVNAGGSLSLTGSTSASLVTTGKVLTVLGTFTNGNTSTSSITATSSTLLFATGSAAGTYTLINSAVQVPAALWVNGTNYSTININDTGAVNYTIPAQTLGDVNVNITSGKTQANSKPFANSGVNLHTLTINSTGTNAGFIQMTTGSGTSGFTFNYSGNLIINGGECRLAGSGTSGNTTATNVSGNVTVNGGKLDIATSTGVIGNLSVGGNLTVANGASLVSTTNLGTIILNGSSATQNVDFGTSATITNINCSVSNATYGATLTKAASLTTLTLTSGKLYLGNNNLTLNGANAVGGTLGIANHIVTDGSGYVKIASLGTGGYRFPVGYDASNYNPVTLTPTLAQTNVTVRALTSTYGGSNQLKAMWDIGGIASATNFVFPWNTTDDQTGTVTTSGEGYQFDGSTWVTKGGTSVVNPSAPNYKTTITGVTTSTASNYWTVAVCSTPPTISSVTAAANPICSNATTTLTANGVGGLNPVVKWYSATNGGGTYYTPDGTTIDKGPGTYYARVTGDCGAAVEASITITVANTIATQPTDNQSELLGGTTTMSVVATGSNPTYQWYSNTTKSNVGGTIVTDGTNNTAATFTPESSAPGLFYYYCEVTTDCGVTLKSNAVDFTVIAATMTLTSGSTPQALILGDALSTNTYTWTNSATASVVWTGTSSSSTPPDGISVNINDGASTVTISGTPTVGGAFGYTVSTTNLVQPASASGSFTVKLATPTIGTASTITASGFTANWTTVANATSYTIKVYQGASVVKTQTGVSASGYAITGLSPVTAYNYTVTATASGISSDESSASAGFTTINNACDITVFAFAGQISSTIVGTNVTVVMPAGTYRLSLAPTTITTSASSAVSPLVSVAQDFRTSKTYTVTAEDGTIKTYTVTVTNQTPVCSGTFSLKNASLVNNGTTGANFTAYGQFYTEIAGSGAGSGKFYRIPAASSSITLNADATCETGGKSMGLTSSTIYIDGSSQSSKYVQLFLTPDYDITGLTINTASTTAGVTISKVATLSSATFKGAGTTGAGNSYSTLSTVAFTGTTAATGCSQIGFTCTGGTYIPKNTFILIMESASGTVPSSINFTYNCFTPTVLTTPTLSDATNPNSNGFTANWSDVSNELGYTINVYSGNTLVNSYSAPANATSLVISTGLSPNTDYTYTVTAIADGDLRTNSVESTKSNVVNTSNSAAFITAFTIAGQVGSSVIDNTAKTVSVLIPYGVKRNALTPSVSISSGASISTSGVKDFRTTQDYTVTALDGVTTNTYTVTVGYTLVCSDVAIGYSTPNAFPAAGLSSTLSSGNTEFKYSAASGTALSASTGILSGVSYTVSKLSSSANSDLTINYIEGAVTANSAGSNISALQIASNINSTSTANYAVVFSGSYPFDSANIVGTPQELTSSPNNIVTMSPASVASVPTGAKSFRAYRLVVVRGTTYGTSSSEYVYYIKASVCPSTTATALITPTVGATTSITNQGFTANWTDISNELGYTVKVYSGATLVSTVSGIAANATSTVISGLSSNTTYTYTVTGIGDGDVYTNSAASSAANVRTLSTSKDITAFTIAGVTATIGANTITATVPYSTVLTSLTPIVTVSQFANYSPTGAQDFSASKNYTVTAEDGSTKVYSVIISKAAASSIADITAFSIAGQLSSNISGTSISVVMPFGTTDYTALVPTFTLTAFAISSPLTGISQDFTNPMDYAVTAEDGSTIQHYTVTVTNASQPSITPSSSATISFATSGWSASSSQSITLNGANLSANVVATVASPYQVSLNGSNNWGTSVSYTPTSGIVTAAALYIRYNPSSGTGVDNGTLSLSSTNATSVNITLNGISSPVITLTSGAAKTYVKSGVAMTDVVYNVTGSVALVSVTGLPAGITNNYSGGTLTISGTPSTSLYQNFPFAITVDGATGATTATRNDTIKIYKHNLGFVYTSSTPPAGANKLYSALLADSSYYVSVITASNTASDTVPGSSYLTSLKSKDLLVLHENVNSANLTALAIGRLIGTMPILNTKAHMYGKTNWPAGSGNNDNVGDVYVKVINGYTNHPIFNGATLNISDSSKVVLCGSTGIIRHASGISYTNGTAAIARNRANATSSIVEFNNSTTSDANKYLLIAMSAGAEDFSSNGLLVYKNAVEYLLGSSVYLPVFAYNVTGTAMICAGSSTNITLSNSQTGVSYQLYKDGIATGSPLSGTTGSFLTWNVSVAGAYTVQSVTAGNYIANAMSGTATITINPSAVVTPSVVISTTSGTTVCAGSTVTFTATPTNGGGAPTYNFLINGVSAQNGSSASFTSSSNALDAAYIPDGGIVKVVLTANNVCQVSNTATSNDITFHYATSINDIWTGNSSTDFNTAGNWCSGVVPSGGVISINAVNNGRYPVLNSTNLSLSTLSLASGTTFGLGTGSLTITGTITGTGLFVGSSTGTLSMNSSSANTLNFTSADTLVGTLTLNGVGKVTLGSGVGISSLLSLNNAAAILDLNNNHLTLKSTSLANTAEVGVVAHGATIINGNVTVERYIPKELRNYRDLGASVANAGSVFANWQENGNAGNTVNNGFFITGTAAKYSPYIPGKIFEPISGLDYTTAGAPSMYTYTGTTWPAVTSTKALSLNPFQGYRAIVRGARNFNMGTNPNTMPTATTVRATGKLITGDVTITTAGTTVTDNSAYNSSFALTSGSSAYSLIANPYACPVQWSKVLGHSSIYNTYWYLDPTYQDPGTGLQRYITVQYSGGITIVTPNPKGGSNLDASFDYIQSGQAIMVNNYGNGTPSISFREADKTTGATNNDVFKQTTPSLMSIELYKNNSLADAAVANFNNSFTKAIGTEDASKMINSAENISITESNNDLSIDGLPTPSVNDVLPVRLGQLKANTTYQLKADISKFNTAGLQAYVRDNMLNTEVAAGNMISFTPTSVDVQSYKDRFSIVFKQSKVVVPVVIVKGSISVFPNPVTAKSFKVQTSNIAAGKYNVVIVNSFGQEVMSTPITHLEGSNTETITMSKALTSGVYTLVLKSAEGKTVYQTELLAK